MAFRRKGIKQISRLNTTSKCCSWLKLKRLTLVILTSITILNIATGVKYCAPLFEKQIKSIWFLHSPWKFHRSFWPQEVQQECRQLSLSFNDPFNQTLITYAGMKVNEGRFVNVLRDLIDGRFSASFNRRIQKPRFHQFQAKFRRGLKLLEVNMRMSYKPQVMQELLAKVKGPIDEHYSRMNNSRVVPDVRYRSCAVVGNSGEVLSNRTRGSFIDSHDMVIRINNANVKGYAADVDNYIGSKTTLMFMNSHILHQCSRNWKCSCHPFGVEVPIMLYLCAMEHMLDIACCGSEHQAPLFLTDKRFDILVARIARWYSIKRFFHLAEAQLLNDWNQWELLNLWEGLHQHEFHYSSGMQAVVLALGLCEQVNLFGFGKNPKYKHHFHTHQRAEYHGHDYEAEYLFYHDLQRRKLDGNPFLCGADTHIPPVQVFH